MSSTPGLVWTRPPRTTRATLDRDAVVAAAIAILDTDGINGLSMRRLAADLNATAPSLYWHVTNKDELLDIAFDEVMGELPDMTANASGDWRADIRAAMDALRDMMLRHHWFPVSRPGPASDRTHFVSGRA